MRLHNISTFLSFASVAFGSAFPGHSAGSIQRQDLERKLGSLLSSGAGLYFPDSATWGELNTRWTPFGRPTFSAIVEVATAEDVQNTVKYAVQKNIKFLVQNGGHGDTITLEKMRSGIQINMRKLNSAQVFPQNKTALVGGGIRNYDLIQEVHRFGLDAATGTCSCVGVMGAGLGGGHGRLQGVYGLILDNIISMRVVLATGELVEVSKTSNQDLFWAMRGAGHNFGIVVDFVYQLHAQQNNGEWYSAHWSFTGKAIEPIFDIFNAINYTQPDTMSFGVIYAWPSNTTAEPIVTVTMDYAGPASIGETYAKRFDALDPLPGTVDHYTTTWDQVSERTFTGLNSSLCVNGVRRSQFPVNIKGYDISTQKAVWKTFEEYGRKYPGLRDTSNIVYEIYPLKAFAEVPSNATAYPHRGYFTITNMQAGYADASLDPIGIQWGKEVRQLLVEGSGFGQLQSYMNYALGDEPLGALYGYDGRLNDLKALKKIYDPRGRFSNYHPLL